MKKLTLFTTLILCTFILSNINAQKKSSLNLHSANIGFGGFYIENDINENGGTSFVVDLTTAIHKNLMSISYLTGAEIGVVGESTFNFNEFGLLYGREAKIEDWLSFEFFAGLGYYTQEYKVNSILTGNSVSFPLKINTKFYFNKKFGMGINTNYSINRINNNLSINLIFHYRFHSIDTNK